MTKKEVDIDRLKKDLDKLDKIIFFLESSKTSEGFQIIKNDFDMMKKGWTVKMLKEDKSQELYRLQGKLQVASYFESVFTIYTSKRNAVIKRLKELEGYPNA
jgi:hypothetical protein